MSSSGRRRTELSDLSPEQREVVETWGQGVAVLAGAGSGKTTTLVIKCEELLKHKPGARLAAVSFTEKSASDLRLKLSDRLSLEGEGGALSGHWVMTIHGLCGAILREFPREAGFDGEESMLAESEAQLLWERATEGLWYDQVPEEVAQALQALLERESRSQLVDLLRRMRDLEAFGALGFLSGSEDPSARQLSVLSRFVLDRYERLKRRRGALDFGDLERGADQALEHAHVRESFRRRFDLVLVDEFQDTNPLQARIITRFCREDLSNLCVVGDPKQSIYRFRDADVSVFQEFCEKLPVRKVLSWNFRSRPDIIRFTNRICSQAFEASSMEYDALEPKRDAQADGNAVIRLDVKAPGELAAWITEERARGVHLHDMALLVRRVRGNEKWLKALTASGIPIAVGSGGLFWEEPRARELAAFLRWWDDSSNALSGCVFLRAPWVGVPDEVIDRWISEGRPLQDAFLASDHPLAAALAALRGKIIRPGELLLELLIDEGVEREIGNPLLGLWHRVEDFSSRGLDFHQVVLEVGRSVEEQRRERDVPPPKNRGQLSVLTFHGSKGLEFPHVILIDFGKRSRSMPAPLLFWDRTRGAYLSPRDADGERDWRHPTAAAWRDFEKQRNIAESKRIFYVALTRAQERLILVCPELEAKDLEKECDPENAFQEDSWRAWLECSQIDIPRELMNEKDRSAAGPDQMRENQAACRRPGKREAVELIRPRHSVTEWNLLSQCPRAYEWTYIRPQPELRTPQRLEERQRESGDLSQKDLGTLVHAALEYGDYEKLEELEWRAGQDRFSAAALREWAERSPLMRSQENGIREVLTELSFEVPVGHEALVGSIDRLVVERGDGGNRATIVDFKVSSAPKSAEALIRTYRTQMDLYGWALGRLDSSIADEDVRRLLVNVSAGQVLEVEVPRIGFTPDALARQAAGIVNGQSGEVRPGPRCQYCMFSARCQPRS